MQKYELLITLPGTLDENEASSLIQEVAGLVKVFDSGAAVNNLGKIRLAYPIKQIRYGYFYTVVFSAESGDVKALEQKLSLRADLLRSMLTHFNTDMTVAKKIAYNTNEAGVTTMKVKEEAGVELPAKKVDLKDIDEKLNEILDNAIIAGV